MSGGKTLATISPLACPKDGLNFLSFQKHSKTSNRFGCLIVRSSCSASTFKKQRLTSFALLPRRHRFPTVIASFPFGLLRCRLGFQHRANHPFLPTASALRQKANLHTSSISLVNIDNVKLHSAKPNSHLSNEGVSIRMKNETVRKKGRMKYKV